MKPAPFAPLGILFRELIDGPSTPVSYMLHREDAGLLRSLDKLSAAEASAAPPGRSSIAAHVDHVRYYLERMNGWASGRPLPPADWGASWLKGHVSEDQWRELRAQLSRQVAAWDYLLEHPTIPDTEGMFSFVSSIAHIAYHLGAIRQLSHAVRGPRPSH